MEHCFDGPQCDRRILRYEYVFAVCGTFPYCDCDIYRDNGVVDWVWFVYYCKTARVLIDCKKYLTIYIFCITFGLNNKTKGGGHEKTKY